MILYAHISGCFRKRLDANLYGSATALTLAVITMSLTWLVFCGSLLLLPLWNTLGGTGGGFFSIRPLKQVEWWPRRPAPPGPPDKPFLLRLNFWAALWGGKTRSHHELLIMKSFISIYINDDINQCIDAIVMYDTLQDIISIVAGSFPFLQIFRFRVVMLSALIVFRSCVTGWYISVCLSTSVTPTEARLMLLSSQLSV